MTAHSRLSSKFLAVAALALAASGCIITPTPTGSNGDITFTWSLNGRMCGQAPEVTQVVIQIPGQTLQNQGVYGCNNGGTDGIKLLNFRPGTYSYTITAQNGNGVGVFQATGRVIVNGNVAEHADLRPTTNATGSAYIAWTLPQGSRVTCQYLASVDVTIDNGAPTPVACATGLYNPSVATLQGFGVALSPGTHTVQIDARDQNGLYYYRKIASITVNAAETSQQVFSLDWLVGTVPLRWAFSNGASLLTCQQAGVSEVTVTFRDQSGDLTQRVPCSFEGIDGYVPYVYGGSFQVFVGAVGAANLQYASSPTAPPIVTAQAGVFPPLTSSVQPLIVLSL